MARRTWNARHVVTFYVCLLILLGMYEVLHSQLFTNRFVNPNQHVEPTPQYPGVWLVIGGDDNTPRTICHHGGHLFGNILVHDNSSVYALRCKEGTGVKKLHWTSPLCPGSTPYCNRFNAYLHAIKEGAEFIYTADSHHGLSSVKRLIYPDANIKQGLFFNGEALSPYWHFRCEGLPKNNSIEQISIGEERKLAEKYQLCNMTHPSLQVQAFFSYMKQTITAEQVACNPQVPPVSLRKPDPDLFFDTNNALFHKHAFWALPISQLTESPEERLAWNYCIQLLLKVFGDSIRLFAAKATTSFTKTTMTSTSKAEIKKAVGITFKGFAELTTKSIENVLLRLKDRNIVPHTFARNVMNWLKAIEDLWIPPNRLSSLDCPHKVAYYPWKYHKRHLHSGMADLYRDNRYSILKTIQKTCSSRAVRNIFTNLSISKIHMDNIALVLIFIHPHYSVIPYLESLYRPFFSVIVYCIPTFYKDSLTYKKVLKSGWRLTIVEYGATPLSSYQCVELVVGLQLDVDGYVFLHDDVLLALPNTVEKPLSRPWLANEVKTCDLKELKSCAGHTIFYHLPIRESIIKTYHDLLSFHEGSIQQQCITHIYNSSDKGQPFYMGNSDMYYLPKQMAINVAQLIPIFLRNGVFHEIAVPTMIKCITFPEEPSPIIHNLYWDGQFRNNYDQTIIRVLRGGVDMLHPVKLSYVARKKGNLISAYCNKIIPFFYKHQRTTQKPPTKPTKFSMFALARNRWTIIGKYFLYLYMTDTLGNNRTLMNYYLGNDYKSNPVLKDIPSKFRNTSAAMS